MSKLPALTKSNFEQEVTQSVGTVIIAFSAPWCGPCKVLAPVLEKLAEEAEGKYKVFAVDVDEEDELVKQFGVRSVPMVVVFKAGKVTKTNLGIITKDNLLKMLE